jgi:hypothetical protein
VQILEGKSHKRKVVDLIRALRMNPNTRLFVVLGEPGTGKSVALRKLTRDLLRESSFKDRIPVYINLKEWKTPTDWSPTNRPTTQQLHEFIYNSLLQSVDFTSQAFLAPINYKALLEAGYFFFILDSFDEIPAVLDHDESSWIIADLSECISRYLMSGHESRGIVASRLFRQPKILVKERTVLEIQPFSDDRIIRAIDLACNSPADLKKIVLTERSDLGTIGRNPFLLHLIIYHYNQTGTSPRSQAEMFHTFIDLNIRQARAAYGLEGYTEDEIYDACERIAATMFAKTRAGLEIGEPELKNELDLPQLPFVLRFLTQARLGRIAPVSGAFSFSHRRFNEYFLVRRLNKRRGEIPFDAIQTDSRWRDALVLFAEIANENDAKQLAEHAWQFASQLARPSALSNPVQFLQNRHALRFLVDGFRNRPQLIEPYQTNLEDMIREKLSSRSDYIEKKTTLEAIALLPAEPASLLIIQSLHKYPGWISEEAAASARYLKKVSPLLAAALYRHCVARYYFNGLIEARRELRVLSISPAFASVVSQLRWYLFDVAFSSAGLIAIVLIMLASQDPFWLKNVPAVLVVAPAMIGTGMLARLVITPPEQRKFRRRRGNLAAGTLMDFTAVPRFVGLTTIFVVLFNLFLATIHAPRPLLAPRFEDVPAALNIAILCIAATIGIPLRPSAWHTLLQRRWFLRSPITSYIVGMIGSIVILGTLAALLPARITEYAAFGMLIILAVAVIWMIGMGILWWWRDHRALSNYKKKFLADRTEIAKEFSSLQTQWGRMAYVHWLEKISVNHLDTLRRPNNQWPAAGRPQRDGDEATVRLAQIDMRWRDLS